MTIGEYIEALGPKGAELEEKFASYWMPGQETRYKGYGLNFFSLLIDVPLWKFNELYGAWYDATPDADAGPMGMFMECRVTDEQAREFIETGTVTFRKE